MRFINCFDIAWATPPRGRLLPARELIDQIPNKIGLASGARGWYFHGAVLIFVTFLSGCIGAILGSVLRPVIDNFFYKKQRSTKWRRESLHEQLTELYHPLYVQMVISPKTDPEHYFDDWDRKEFHQFLVKALGLIIPYIHLAPEKIIDNVHSWREIASKSDYDAESAVRELYDHIVEHFAALRKELEIT